MIRILISAPAKTGLFPYRIDGHWGPGGAPLIGIAEDPVQEAYRVLEALGVRYGTPFVADYGGSHISHHWVRKTPPRKTLPPPQKGLPAPRRARRKALVVRGSGVPGDG